MLDGPIASLITTDIVQHRLLGEKSDVSGKELASAFLAGIPPQLRPASLSSSEIEDMVLALSESIMQRIYSQDASIEDEEHSAREFGAKQGPALH